MNARLKVLLATGGLCVAPGLVSAQDPPAEPRVYYACYQPLLGLVYRIREPGLPQTCFSSRHVMFSWNETGPAGPAGAAGEAGEAGATGERGLTGLACWDANGNGVADPAEDVNGDQAWDARDCQGPAGPPGTATIPPGSITELELANSSVTALKVTSGAISSAHIASGAIGTEAIADRSITAADIGFDQITSTEIANRSITGVHLADGAVGPQSIAPNAINSSHVADGSLRAADLAPGTVTLSANYVNSSVTISPGQYASVVVSCPPGQRVTGGGYSAQMPDVTVIGSWPEPPSAWRAYVRNNGASSSGFAVVAVCMATQIP